MDRLEVDFNALRDFVHAMNHGLRTDVWNAIMPLSVDLFEIQPRMAVLTATLERIDRRTERLEIRAADEDEARPARQAQLDTSLKAIEVRQDRRWRYEKIFAVILIAVALIALGAWVF